MGETILEDFSDASSANLFKVYSKDSNVTYTGAPNNEFSSGYETEFAGKQGVAWAYTNDSGVSEWGSQKIAGTFNLTKESLATIDFDYINYSIYIDADGTTSGNKHTVNSYGVSLGVVEPRTWIDLQISKEQILSSSPRSFYYQYGGAGKELAKFAEWHSENGDGGAFFDIKVMTAGSTNVAPIKVYFDEISFVKFETGEYSTTPAQGSQFDTLNIVMKDINGKVIKASGVTATCDGEDVTSSIVNDKLTLTNAGEYSINYTFTPDGKSFSKSVNFGVNVLQGFFDESSQTKGWIKKADNGNNRTQTWLESLTDKNGVTKKGVLNLNAFSVTTADNISDVVGFMFDMTSSELAQLNVESITINWCYRTFHDSPSNDTTKNLLFVGNDSNVQTDPTTTLFANSVTPENVWIETTISINTLKSYARFSNGLSAFGSDVGGEWLWKLDYSGGSKALSNFYVDNITYTLAAPQS